MSKNILINSFMLMLGAAIGGGVTYALLKDKYVAIAEDEISQMREYYEEKYSEEKKDHMKGSIEYVIKGMEHSSTDKEEQEEDEDMYVPEVIAPEESWEKEYPTISLTYFAGDGVLADDTNKIIKNVKELVGEDFASHFGEYEDDSVFIRNDNLGVYYEILRDNGSYSDYMESDEC